MTAVLLVLILLSPVAAVVGWMGYRLYYIAVVWRYVGAEYGLEFSSGIPLSGVTSGFRLSGRYRGVPLRIETVTDWEYMSYTGSEIYTRCTASLPGVFPSNVVIAPDGEPERTEPLLSAPVTLHVERPAIEDYYVVRADRPEEVRAFLDRPELADAFELLNEAEGSVEIGGGELFLEIERFVEESRELEMALDVVADFCRAIRDAGPPESELADDAGDEASDARDEVESEEYAHAWE